LAVFVAAWRPPFALSLFGMRHLLDEWENRAERAAPGARAAPIAAQQAPANDLLTAVVHARNVVWTNFPGSVGLR
jgi:hypothetical protein